jgi:hypothetical protein
MFNRSILFLTIGLLASLASADEPAPLADQPIVILRSGGFSTKTGEDYFRKLRDDLGVGNKLASQIEQNKDKPLASKLDKPVSGLLVYLSPGLFPSVEQIQFTEVADHGEFIRLINARSSLTGATAKLEGSGDLYSMVVTNTWRDDYEEILPASNTEVVEESSDGRSSPEDAANDPAIGVDEEPPATTNSVTISIGGSTTGAGVVVGSVNSNDEGKVIEENGKKFREYSSTNTSYFRYHDGFLFESQTNALHKMNLPSGDSLRQMDNADVGGEVVFHPDRIPMGIRMLGWNALSTAAGAELQQRDEEPEQGYAVRRSAGEAGLALIRSAMFDTEKVSTWIKVPFDENPVQGEFRINARKNSDLGRTLREVSSPERRFAPILNDDAAATVYLAAHLPEEWRSVVSAYLASVTADVANSPDYSDAERVAQLTWYKSLASLAEHGNVEFCVKLGWTKESGGVIYGGIQLNDNPELLAAIQSAINEAGEADAQIELVQLYEMPMLKMPVPTDVDMEPINLTHVYLANIDSCLWFAVGGENVHEIIRQSVKRCREAGGRIATPVFTASVDLQRWADYPQDDATGLTAQHSRWYSLMSFFVSWTVEDFTGAPEEEDDEDTSRSEVFNRALALGGSKVMSFTIDTDESGMVSRVSVGEAVARAYAAISVLSIEDLVSQSMDPNDEPSQNAASNGQDAPDAQQ